MRKNTLGILLIVIFIMILIVSCDGTSKLPDVEDSTSEQTQSSLPQTPTLGMSPEDAPEKSSTNIKGENASGIGFSFMEKAYYSKYHELADKYGTHTLYDVKLEYGGHSYLDGVCIVNFMDFNGDGIQDLFVVYSNGQMNRIVIDNYDLEIFDFPAKDTYEIEVWTYKNGELILLLHESCVSVQDSSYYSYHDADELIALYCQFSITVFENEARFPVIQIYNYDERDEVSEYSNIYFSKGKIVRDKLTYKAPVFLMNDSEITWSIWSENVAGYDRILLSALLANSWIGSSGYLHDEYGIDYNYTLSQTGRVIRTLSESDETSEISNWFTVEEEYISLYSKEILNSNWIRCEWEDTEKHYKEHYYNLYDIDQNGVPELILFESSSGAGTHYHFYTITDGETIYCGSYGRASLYVNAEGGLIADFARMGGYLIELLTLDDGEIQTALIATNYWEENATDYPTLKELGHENYEYLAFCPPIIPFRFYAYN